MCLLFNKSNIIVLDLQKGTVMGLISKLYLKKFVCRYDKQVGVPYYSFTDFKGLKEEKGVFTNSIGVEIHYFYYYFDGYKKDKIILFLPGIGTGHIAYFREINELCKRGYKVLTLDYCGCGESKGDNLRSLVEPTRDVNDLSNHLKLENVVLIGHSLGGFTTVNLIHERSEIHKGVVLSGFLTIPSLLKYLIKFGFVNSRILSYERKVEPYYSSLDNVKYLSETTNKLFFIHSVNDQLVSYKSTIEVVESLNNPNIKTLTVNNRFHNPNYTDEAAKYLMDTFGKYNKLVKEKKIKTDEDRINFFKDVSLERLTEQDQKIFDQIVEFIDKDE